MRIYSLYSTCERLSSPASSSSSSTGAPEAKRRKVKYETYQHWITQYDRECLTASWLDCEVETLAGKRYVTKLKCRICHKYNDSIIGRRNYSDKWIEGAESVRTTNIRDHAKLWWEAKQRRPNQSQRKHYQPRTTSSCSSSMQATTTLTTRPELIIHSTLPIIQILYSQISFLLFRKHYPIIHPLVLISVKSLHIMSHDCVSIMFTKNECVYKS